MPSTESVHSDEHDPARKRLARSAGEESMLGYLPHDSAAAPLQVAPGQVNAPTPGEVVRLQRTLGNQAIGAMLRESGSLQRHAAEQPDAEIARDVDAVPDLQREFTSPANLTVHFNKHNGDFGFGDEAEYEEAADDHYANRANLQSKVSGGKTYVYDDATDTFGSYNAAGKTITFFKPCHNNAGKEASGYGQTYFDNQ